MHLCLMIHVHDQVLTVGPHAGKKVQDAKKLIQSEMVASGEAVLYQEPERTVTTRSGDQCVVALTDQWWVGLSVLPRYMYMYVLRRRAGFMDKKHLCIPLTTSKKIQN